MGMSIPKVDFTDEESLEFLTTGRILNDKTLIQKVQRNYIENRRHEREWPTVVRVLREARKYRKRIPKAVKEALSDWSKQIRATMFERARLHQKSYLLGQKNHRQLNVLGNLPDGCFDSWENLSSHSTYYRYCKRWAILAIDSAERQYKKLGVPIPKIDVEITHVDNQFVCGVGYSKGYPTIYIGNPNYRGFALTRWRGHISIGRSPDFLPVYLEVRNLDGEHRLVAVVPDDTARPTHRWLYSFGGISDWEVRADYSRGYRVMHKTVILAASEMVDALYGVNGTDTTKKCLLFSNKQ